MRSFRLNCQPHYHALVLQLLQAEGFEPEQEAFSSFCFSIQDEPKPLGKSLAALFGYIYIQDRSSMLPPLMLNPEQGAVVLDMCASPGSKTGLLATLVGKHGLVVANELNQGRLITLRHNLGNLNYIQSATTHFSGEQIPFLPESFDYILLDPPCSGWGTEEKNPHISNLWKGDKIKPLVQLQQALLTHASNLLKPNGKLVYSTCTTNKEENEEQVVFAIEQLNLTHVPLTPPAGFAFNTPLLPQSAGALRVDGEASQAQGFFIACFTKHANWQTPAYSIQKEQEKITANKYIKQKKQKASTPDLQNIESIAPDTLQTHGFDTTLLPEGKIAAFGDALLFLHNKALVLFPDSMPWRGFTMGKTRNSSHYAGTLAPHLRFLMPTLEEAHSKSHVVYNATHIEEIIALQNGQSLVLEDATIKSSSMLLYWNGLPLGTAKASNGRIVWAVK